MLKRMLLAGTILASGLVTRENRLESLYFFAFVTISLVANRYHYICKSKLPITSKFLKVASERLILNCYIQASEKFFFVISPFYGPGYYLWCNLFALGIALNFRNSLMANFSNDVNDIPKILSLFPMLFILDKFANTLSSFKYLPLDIANNVSKAAAISMYDFFYGKSCQENEDKSAIEESFIFNMLFLFGKLINSFAVTKLLEVSNNHSAVLSTSISILLNTAADVQLPKVFSYYLYPDKSIEHNSL
jgi:hypothetical protein